MSQNLRSMLVLWKRREFVKTIVVERGVFLLFVEFFKMNIRVVERGVFFVVCGIS